MIKCFSLVPQTGGGRTGNRIESIIVLQWRSLGNPLEANGTSILCPVKGAIRAQWSALSRYLCISTWLAPAYIAAPWPDFEHRLLYLFSLSFRNKPYMYHVLLPCPQHTYDWLGITRAAAGQPICGVPAANR